MNLKKTIKVMWIAIASLIFVSVPVSASVGNYHFVLYGDGENSGSDDSDESGSVGENSGVTDCQTKPDDYDYAFIRVTDSNLIDSDECYMSILSRDYSALTSEVNMVEAGNPCHPRYDLGTIPGAGSECRLKGVTYKYDVTIEGRWEP